MDFHLHHYQNRQGHQHPSQIAGKTLPDQSKTAAVGRPNREALGRPDRLAAQRQRPRPVATPRLSGLAGLVEAVEASSASLLGDAHDDRRR
jgi:hypothetical protein